MTMIDSWMISLLVALLIVLAFVMVFLHEVLFDYASSDADYSHWEKPLFYGVLIVLAGYFAQFLSLRFALGRSAIDLNLTGFIIPVCICLLLLFKFRRLKRAMLPSTVAVAVIGYFATTVQDGTVVSVFPYWLLPVAAAIALSFILVREGKESEKAAIAYFSGTLGMLIGGDLFRVPSLLLPGSTFSLGAGGLMDFVFLVGPFSVAGLWATCRVLNIVLPRIRSEEMRQTRLMR